MSDYIDEAFDSDDVWKKNGALRKASKEIERLRTEVESLDAEADRWMERWNTAVTERQLWQVKAEATLAENARLREALEDHVRAAECIRHWHDTLGDEGMVVSAEHVRLLWEATSRARAALAEKEEK